AEERPAHRHVGDALGPLDAVALADVVEGAHPRDADVVLLEVEDQPLLPVLELHQLSGLHALQAVDPGDAIALAEDGAGLGDGDLLAVVLDLLAEDSADLVGADVHGPEGRVWGAAKGTPGKGRPRPDVARRGPFKPAPGAPPDAGAGALPPVQHGRNDQRHHGESRRKRSVTSAAPAAPRSCSPPRPACPGRSPAGTSATGGARPPARSLTGAAL